jgi:FKBP-type peptidyl-prolyl cis-trans isomerase FkpA
MQRIFIVALILLMAIPAYAAKKKPVVRPLTEEQKALYAIGLVLARQLEVFNLTPAELRIVKRGLNDATKGRKSKVDFAAYSNKSQALAATRRDAHGKKLEAKAAAFIEEAAEEEGAVKSKSGVVYRSLREGQGEPPAETETIKIHYRILLIDDKEMDSTYKRGEPEEAKVNEFIKCLNEGVQLMRPGGRARLVCPPETALGKEGNGVIPANATLVYDIELVEVVRKTSDDKAPQPEQKK